MTIDTRTEAERRYDAERDGSLYTASQPSAAKLLAFLEGIPEEHQEMALLGVELMCYAHGNRPIPDRLRTAVWAEQYERGRQQGRADAATLAAKPEAKNDEPSDTILDDGTQSGILIERHDRVAGSCWIDFEIDPGSPAWLLIGATIAGHNGVESGPIELIVKGNDVEGPWTLESLRKLHNDLGHLLADERVIGAVSQAWAACEAQR